MINEKELEYLCNKYGIEYQLFQETDTIIINVGLDKWEVKYFEDIQEKLNLLYKEREKVKLKLLNFEINEPSKNKLLFKYDKINEKIKETRPYYLCHGNKYKLKFRHKHKQGWRRNLFQVIDTIIKHKKVIYGIHTGLPYIHNTKIKFNKYNINKMLK